MHIMPTQETTVTFAHDALIRDEPTLAQLDRDEEGFLLNADDWHPDLINAFAAEDELEIHRNGTKSSRTSAATSKRI